MAINAYNFHKATRMHCGYVSFPVIYRTFLIYMRCVRAYYTDFIDEPITPIHANTRSRTMIASDFSFWLAVVSLLWPLPERLKMNVITLFHEQLKYKLL